MDIAQSQIQGLNNPSIKQSAYPAPKAVEHKANESGGAGDLRTWYNDAWEYYNQVMSGTMPMPEQIHWNEFLTQLNWAKGQLFGASQGGWDPNAVAAGAEPEASPAPEGAYLSPNGEHVFDLKESHIYFDGDMTTAQVFSHENVLDIPSMGASVEMVVVPDPETSGVNILKVKITYVDGRTKVINYDEYENENFSLQINGANPENIHIPQDIADTGKVTQEEFEAGRAPEEMEITMNGEPVEGEPLTDADGNEIEGGQYFEANSMMDQFQISPKAGEENTYMVVGNTSIDVPLSSSVVVTGTLDPDQWDYTIIVTHKDGTQDKILVKDDFKVDIHAVADEVTFNLDDEGALDEPLSGAVPEGLADIFSLNGGQGEAAASGGVNPDYPEDTQPDEDPQSLFWPDWNDGSKGDFAVYDNSEVNIHPTGDPSMMEIHANSVNITLDSMLDEISQVSAYSSANGHTFYQLQIKYKDGSTQTILVNKDAQITINGGTIREDQVVNLSKGEYPIIHNRGGVSEGGAIDGGENPEVLANLLAETGATEASLLMALQSAGYDYDNIQQVRNAFRTGELPPEELEPKFVGFLYYLDPEFAESVDLGIRYDKERTEGDWSSEFYDAVEDAEERLVELLQVAYPDMGTSIRIDGTAADSFIAIHFGSRRYHVFTFDGPDMGPEDGLGMVEAHVHPGEEDEE